jgi:hypothetical protein
VTLSIIAHIRMSFAVNTIIFCYVNTSITYRVTLTLELEILTRWPRVVLLTLTIPILILVGIWTTVITLHHIRPPAGAAMPVALTYILTTSIADVVAIAIALAEQIPDGVFSAGFAVSARWAGAATNTDWVTVSEILGAAIGVPVVAADALPGAHAECVQDADIAD